MSSASQHNTTLSDEEAALYAASPDAAASEIILKHPSWVEVATTVLSIALVAFLLYTTLFGQLSADIQRGIPFALVALLILARKPIVPGATWLRLIDLVVAAGAIYAIGYVAVFGGDMASRIGRLLLPDVIACSIGLLVLFEIARRTIGILLPSIALALALYAIFGAYFPAPFNHRGFSAGRVALAGWIGSDGVFGIAFGVMVSVVFVYMQLAALMEHTGAGQALLQLARVITGGARSGPGLTTVVGSALFGTASGSGVADVAAIGPANIPAMKRAGYKPDFAASVQALSSIGAQVLPPVMGSSAFIIAELTGTPYAQIALMAIIPALLYFVSVAAAVHFQAGRLGLSAGNDNPDARVSWFNAALALAPLGLLIVLLVTGSSPARAAMWAIAALLVLSAFSPKTRIGPAKLVEIIRIGSINSIPLWTATAVIGMIVAAVGLTGVANLISGMVIGLSQSSLLLALIVTTLASIVLGTALPTIAAYLLLVIMVAPTLVSLGLPLVVAHFFVFFYGVTSDLTPPTALAPLTASAIAGGNFWKTCLVTMRIGLPIFIIPFAFVYNPALLLMGSPMEIIISAAFATIGISSFAAANAGFFIGTLAGWQRIVLLVAGLAMLLPERSIGVAALVAIMAIAILQWRTRPGGGVSAA
ncbi:hypothetical protein ASD04_00735 [Devosia sp. Root436]|uniref:TRAP transporter permease n=1 Tax=Devosia sp. Root436 TaxID=1736537 RepID=UPI0006FE57AC|nr:TRAP transporter fused permease subunit [Devosia sp. Root436]KQX42530.1 hypothetical protein ASD04_00735 [Devosia sp. Root436]